MFWKTKRENKELKRKYEKVKKELLYRRAKETKAIDILTSDINPYTKLRDLKEMFRE